MWRKCTHLYLSIWTGHHVPVPRRGDPHNRTQYETGRWGRYNTTATATGRRANSSDVHSCNKR